MSVIQINKRTPQVKPFALFQLGFRPFFLAASVFASFSIAMWMAVYFSHITISMGTISILEWHSHEMIYGYSVAVIAGFLLTAITNWTGVQTIYGKPLLALVSIWGIARISLLFGTRFLELAALADIAFMIGLSLAVASPLIKARQWKQLGILSKILLLMLGNLSFYLGALGVLEHGVFWGIYGGLYLVIALILTIGGRVIPAFIRNGVDYTVTIRSPKWISALTLILFLLFVVNQLFIHNSTALGLLSSALVVITSVRLVVWHTPGIWRKPLLWSLYLSFVSIDVGFLLFTLSAFGTVSPFLAIHAFAFGGIGLATLGMMSRVVLGHTGRDIRTPPQQTAYALLILTLGAVIRVGFPLVDPLHYGYWIGLSQVCWIASFLIFAFLFSKMLIHPRVDGQPG